jgi:hypothetical protein
MKHPFADRPIQKTGYQQILLLGILYGPALNLFQQFARVGA